MQEVTKQVKIKSVTMTERWVDHPNHPPERQLFLLLNVFTPDNEEFHLELHDKKIMEIAKIDTPLTEAQMIELSGTIKEQYTNWFEVIVDIDRQVITKIPKIKTADVVESVLAMVD